MQDIPMFTTENGVASLILKEIPYCGDAYIRIHDSGAPEIFLRECCDFCVMAGAKTVYAAGKDLEEKYKPYTEVWQMECFRNRLPKTDAALICLQEETLDNWRKLYNTRMCDVPTASFMSCTKAKEILEKGSGYLVYRGDTMLGLGVASGHNLECIISLIPGAGQDVLCALCGALSEDTVTLEVASENKRAVALYKKLGFVLTERLNCWYKVYP